MLGLDQIVFFPGEGDFDAVLAYMNPDSGNLELFVGKIGGRERIVALLHIIRGDVRREPVVVLE